MSGLRWWAAVVLVAAGLAVPGMVSPAPTAAATSAVASGGLTAAGVVQAQALAASSGQPVEVMADRTDWSQTFAEPDGGFSASESLVPQRVQESDGSWVPLDTTLSVQADGQVAPAAITTGLSLSAGGSGPLYTLSQGGQSLAVSWPLGRLPVPSLSGATATYDDVLPGVNLLVTATPTGVSDLIEVTSPEAAANPALAQITFPVAGQGLSVSADAHGTLTAADGSGTAVFTAPPAQMWDSAGQQDSAGSSAASAAQADSSADPADQADPPSPVPGDHQAVMDVSATSAQVSLTPVPQVLSGPQVVYPVFIDPTWDSDQSKGATWSDVEQQGSHDDVANNHATAGDNWEYTSSDFGGIRSGVNCDPSIQSTGNCASPTTYMKVRSFLNFPVPSAMHGATFADAQLEVLQKWSWGCTSTPAFVTMWDTASNGHNVATTPSTTWGSQPGTGEWLDHDAHDYGYSPGGCNPHAIFLQAKQAAQDAADGNWDKLTLRLSATDDDESSMNLFSWKRFDASSMVLHFYWRNAPDTPTNYGTQETFDRQTGQTVTHCGTSGAPDYVHTNAPQWQATISDQDDQGGNLNGEFAWTNTTVNPPTTGTLDADQNTNGQSSGSQFTASRPGSAGDLYKWQAYGTTRQHTDPEGNAVPILNGPKTFPACFFWADTANPPAPTITSDSYTSGQASQPVGTPGQFTFSVSSGYTDPDLGFNDVAGFKYGIDTAPSAYVPASGLGGTATVPFVPFTNFENDLFVQTVDAAGNVSGGVTEFQIVTKPPIANIAPLGWWKLNNHGDDSAIGDPGAVLSLLDGASYGCPTNSGASPAGYTCSLALGQSLVTQQRAATNRPELANNASFSVSAWVSPVACLQVDCVALSQGASQVSAFTLGYQASGSAAGTTCPCWVFKMPKQDTSGSDFYIAAAPVRPNQPWGQWTQLTGVFNASHGQLVLYVNGGDGAQQPGDGAAGDGQPAATASASPWTKPGQGALRIGAGWTSASGPTDFFDGSVSDACVFYGALETPDVQALYDKGAGDGCAAVIASHPLQ